LETAKGFRDLIAWQKADRLASLVYQASKDVCPSDRWLVSQVLRCAISVPANIAEGHGRGTKAELLRFLDIARGSLSELEYYIHFMKHEDILPVEKAIALEAAQLETGRVLFGLWKSLKGTNKSWDHTGSSTREKAGSYE
jgi:four helix bundle protein